MAASQKIRIAMLKRNISLNELAERLETSPQNLSGKFRRDNLSEKDMSDIAEVLGCELKISFIEKETGETIA